MVTLREFSQLDHAGLRHGEGDIVPLADAEGADQTRGEYHHKRGSELHDATEQHQRESLDYIYFLVHTLAGYLQTSFRSTPWLSRELFGSNQGGGSLGDGVGAGPGYLRYTYTKYRYR